MPSSSSGISGVKEAYGISIIRDNLSITIPSKAFKRYELSNIKTVLHSTTRIGEAGLCFMNKEKAY